MGTLGELNNATECMITVPTFGAETALDVSREIR